MPMAHVLGKAKEALNATLADINVVLDSVL